MNEYIGYFAEGFLNFEKRIGEWRIGDAARFRILSKADSDETIFFQ